MILAIFGTDHKITQFHYTIFSRKTKLCNAPRCAGKSWEKWFEFTKVKGETEKKQSKNHQKIKNARIEPGAILKMCVA